MEGRAILSLETGDKARPRAVFSATFQPGEPSAWAILAMAEGVLFDAELTRFQEEYDLSFMPMTNPDGVARGSNNVNSKGEKPEGGLRVTRVLAMPAGKAPPKQLCEQYHTSKKVGALNRAGAMRLMFASHSRNVRPDPCSKSP